MINFIKKIFVMFLLMLPLLLRVALVASASSGNAGVNQIVDDAIFGYLSQNITAANSLVIDGSTSNYCPNYVSTSLTYDCF
jgi:hypothetical protein